ncbi:hypothetical protein [Paraburkholderia strydomiana]|uniref:Phage tail protein n=1 Tax=Paraburkholderia strydomiana TaxID=1245417 RepID=A0ABW9CD29_9BURK
MSYAYSNNGLSFRAVADGYVAESGEVAFDDVATAEQLKAAFPQYTGHEATIEWAAHQASAMTALNESDTTVLRCYESAVPVPAAWVAYRKALRAIAGAASGDATQALPTKPAYPAGT